MAKSIILNKEYNRRQRFVGIFLNREVHKSFLKDYNLSSSERQLIYNKLAKYRYSSSIVRLQTLCMLTGHSRSVYRDVGISRYKFNQMVLNGDIPHLASW